MNRLSVLALTLIGALLIAAPAAPADGPALTPLQAYLEGVWIRGREPTQGACDAHAYREMQIEFEFRKSGGRTMIYEPFDLISQFTTPNIREENGEIIIGGVQRNGEEVTVMRYRREGPDKLRMISRNGGPNANTDIFLYRCGPANQEVTVGVPMEQLEVLTPLWTGGLGFPEIKAGEDARSICRTGAPDDVGDRAWLQFELLGPSHYWVFGEARLNGQPIDFRRVARVERVNEQTLKLHLERWRGGKRVQGEDVLTVAIKPDRIWIAELSRSFARCLATEPNSWGAGRP